MPVAGFFEAKPCNPVSPDSYMESLFKENPDYYPEEIMDCEEFL